MPTLSGFPAAGRPTRRGRLLSPFDARRRGGVYGAGRARGASVSRTSLGVKAHARGLLDNAFGPSLECLLRFAIPEMNAPLREVLRSKTPKDTTVARTAKTSKKRAQQLKHDKFRDATMGAFDRLGHRYQGRGRTILYAIGGLVVLAVLFGVYRTWSARRADRAGLALANAIKIQNAAVTTGTPPPGETGPTFPTERERAQKAVEEFQKVAAEYGDPHREIARYFAAVNLVEVERPRGLSELEALTRSGNDEVAARAKFALGQAREADNDYDGAAALYRDLLDDREKVVPEDTVNFRLASALEKQNKRDEAAEIYFRIADASRKAKDKDGKPVPGSATARDAAQRLQAISPERFAQLPPESQPGPGAGGPNISF